LQNLLFRLSGRTFLAQGEIKFLKIQDATLVDETIGLHVAQHGDREQSRRPHWAIGLFELAGEARGHHDIAGTSDAGAAALAMGDQHRLAEARSDHSGGMADMDHERAAADRGAVDPFRVILR
jgi:hypothetical protein